MPANQHTDGIDLQSKERRQDDHFNGRQYLTLSSLSKLTGFPEEMLKQELLLDCKIGDDGVISMEDLRSAMTRYLKDTFAN